MLKRSFLLAVMVIVAVAGAFALDHAAYIGSELGRADTERTDYVQDGKALDEVNCKPT